MRESFTVPPSVHGPSEFEPFLQGSPDEFAPADFERWLVVARRRWRLAVALCLLALLAWLAAWWVTPRRYEARTILQIERRDIVPGTDQEAWWSEPWWDTEYYPTQHKLLASRGLAELVVDDLLVEGDEEIFPGIARVAENGSQEAKDQARGLMAERLLENLSVHPVPETHLVGVRYRSTSPRLAARVVNTLAEEFLAWQMDTRQSTAARTSEVLGKQVDLIEQDLKERRSQLGGRSALGGEGAVVGIDPDREKALQHLRTLSALQLKASSERLEAELSQVDIEASSNASLLSGQYRALRPFEEKLANLKSQQKAARSVFRPEYPGMVELEEQIGAAEGELRKQRTYLVETARRDSKERLAAALDREDRIGREIEAAQVELATFESSDTQSAGLAVELETRQQLLDHLLQLRAENELSLELQSTQDGNVRIVERALMPTVPYSPRLRDYVVRGIGTGWVLAAGIIFLLELTDRTIRTAGEASEMLGLTVLGVVPDCGVQPGARYVRKRWVRGKLPRSRWQLFENRTKKPPAIDLLPFRQPLHPVSEAYRTLGSGLLGLGGDAPRSLAITSARPGEGKTATVANLGVVMAQFGRSVLLIDGDLRKPRLSTVFGIPEDIGLVQVLARESLLPDAIRETKVPGLNILPAGRSAGTPWQLLASGAMTELIAQVRERFDLVLLDSPPLLSVTDPTLLGARVDGVALCLRSGKVRREEVRACADRLEMGDANVIGIILNGYVPAASGYGNYSYYYQTYSDQAAQTESQRGA